ncbi:MAG TPA: FAD-dependent oxidoreductase [Gaiellales bacterium]
MSAMRTDVLIVGGGLAGARTGESLRAAGFDGTVTIAGAEPHAPYERPALSKEYLLGDRPAADLALRPAGFWDEAAIELLTDTAVVSVDIHGREAHAGNRVIRWRHLVLATGASVRRLPALEGGGNVHHLRTLDDAGRLGDALASASRLAIVGAGFVGLEVASSARRLGASVTVIDLSPIPFAAALGPLVGTRMAAFARDSGVDLQLGRTIASVRRDGNRVRRLVLDNGTEIDCDAVLVGIGARPTSDLVARQLPLEGDGSVAVDAAGRTAAECVFACGDVACVSRGATPSGRVEHWTAAAAGARAVASAITGTPQPPPLPAYFWTDQFDSRLQVLGRIERGVEPELQSGDGWFVARYLGRDKRLQAVALLNRPDLLQTARHELAGRPIADAA